MSVQEAGEAPVEPSDPPRRSLKLSRGDISYTDEGPAAGPAIVAIHGLPGSSRDFRWLAPHLSSHFRLIRPEMPGFGGTPVATEPDRSPEGRARCTLELIHALRLSKPILLGHSMGGVVATAVADLEPGSCGGLALLATPGITVHAMLRRFPFKLFSRLLYRTWIRELLRPLVRVSFGFLGFKRYPDHELIGTMHCVGATSIPKHAERVAALTLPTLLAWCQDDPLIESEIMQELADACPAGPRLTFPQGGHNPQKSHAAEIASALEEWRPGS